MEEQLPLLQLFTLTNRDGQMIVVGTLFVFALYVALKTALFKPMQRHIEAREGVTSGALHTASQMRQKAHALRERYDEAMLQTRIAANKERVEAVSKAKAEASSVVSEAEAKAAKELHAGRQAIERGLEEAHQKAEGEAKALAEILSSKVDAQLTVH